MPAATGCHGAFERENPLKSPRQSDNNVSGHVALPDVSSIILPMSPASSRGPESDARESPAPPVAPLSAVPESSPDASASLRVFAWYRAQRLAPRPAGIRRY